MRLRKSITHYVILLNALGAPLIKNTEKGVPDGFFLVSNMHKIHFRPPGPRWGVYVAPQTPSRMVRGHPSPRFPHFDIGTL